MIDSLNDQPKVPAWRQTRDVDSLLRLRHVIIFALSVKLLLIPAAPSTDFEVHRHWKSMTLNVPLSEWYRDQSSQWTLDYPPFFAYFEYVLAWILKFIHPPLVDFSNHYYASPLAVTLMRLTVILLDSLLIYSVLIYVASFHASQHRVIVVGAILLNPALIVVDSIHFQYNVLPISLVFLSLSALQTFAFPLAAALFTLAVNTKHTLLPLALPLVAYVLPSFRPTRRFILLFIRIGLAVAVTLALAWVPFLLVGGPSLLKDIFKRLFPFERGIMHANWAPNFWSVYATADKVLTRLGFAVRVPDASITTGIIGATRPFASLPNPNPMICSLLSLVGALPSVLRLAAQRTSFNLGCAVVATALSAVLFGWHVHEKALLLPLLLLAPIAFCFPHSGVNVAFLILSSVTSLVVFDLVARDAAISFARFLALAYFAITTAVLSPKLHEALTKLVLLYSAGCVLVEFYANADGHYLFFKDRYAFFPKIVVSLYAFVGVAFSYVAVSWLPFEPKLRP